MISCVSLKVILDVFGEENTEKLLSSFSISRDEDVQRFIRSLAIAYEKSGNSRTFFFVEEDVRFLGFVSLAMSIITLPDKISKSRRKRITGLGRYGAPYVSSYLIGQIARFDGVPREELSGDDMFRDILNLLRESRNIVGGRTIAIDCKDVMVGYYEKRGFSKLDKTNELNHMIGFFDDVIN